ncbi:MAG: hypothetical protein ACSLE0_09220 [Chitinophagaceae bacterium]
MTEKLPLTGYWQKLGRRKINRRFSLLNFSPGWTSNAELFVLNFNKIFSISSGCGQTKVYFPAFANT